VCEDTALGLCGVLNHHMPEDFNLRSDIFTFHYEGYQWAILPTQNIPIDLYAHQVSCSVRGQGDEPRQLKRIKKTKKVLKVQIDLT